GIMAVRIGRLLKVRTIVQVIDVELTALPGIPASMLAHPVQRQHAIRVCKYADEIVTVADYQRTIAQNVVPFSRSYVTLPLRIDSAKFNYRKRTVTSTVQFIHIAYYSVLKDQDMM